VVEEIRQRDALACLEFLKGAQMTETEMLHIEYPLRRAVREVGVAGCAAFIQVGHVVPHDALSVMVRALLIAEFGEDALTAKPGRAPSPPGEDGHSHTRLTAAQQAEVEHTVSEIYRVKYGRVLQVVMGIAKELLPPPSDELRRAVMHNLAAGVRYTFYVSKGNEREIANYVQKFWAALASDSQAKYGQMLQVFPFREAWEGNTFLVYLFGDPKRPDLACDRLLGLLGSDRGVALSTMWEILSDDAITTFLPPVLGQTMPTASPAKLLALVNKLTNPLIDPTLTDQTPSQKMSTLGLPN